MLDYKVSLYLSRNATSKILATASITIAGQIKVTGFKVRNGKFGKYVSMPSIQTGLQDGKPVYTTVCYGYNSATQKKLNERILAAYEAALADPEEKYIEEVKGVSELPLQAVAMPIENPSQVLADVAVNFGQEIVIEGIRLQRTWDGKKIHLVMPSYPTKNGYWAEYCKPITNEFRQFLTEGIIAVYDKELELSRQKFQEVTAAEKQTPAVNSAL